VGQNGQRLGQMLCDADIITKRQLAKAIQKQISGDNRKLGEILVELGYITVEDLTDAMLDTRHEEKAIEEKTVTQPIDISEDVVMKTKFALDIKTMISAAVGIATLVGFWYALQADIQEAKELPKIGNIYAEEYPSRPEGYNWPRSYEQYKDQVGSLQEDMDDVYDTLEEFEEKIEELEKQVTELRIALANKRDK
jgi:predicted unusual protein kinase regulating ubiquinone biosynthesis (AarF/ABC1/UbiB family)